MGPTGRRDLDDVGVGGGHEARPDGMVGFHRDDGGEHALGAGLDVDGDAVGGDRDRLGGLAGPVGTGRAPVVTGAG